MSSPTENPNQKSPLYYLGRLLMVGGATFAGSAVAQQLKNTMLGRHYYDWLAIGIVVAVIGSVCLRVARKRPPNS